MLHIKLAQFAVRCALPPRRSESPICANDHKPSCVLHLRAGLLGRAVFPPWKEGPNSGSYKSTGSLFRFFVLCSGSLSRSPILPPAHSTSSLSGLIAPFSGAAVSPGRICPPLQLLHRRAHTNDWWERSGALPQKRNQCWYNLCIRAVLGTGQS